MSEILKSHEIKRSSSVFGSILIGSLALSGCAATAEATQVNVVVNQQYDVSTLTPVSRFDYDYVWGGCLETTAYGPETDRAFSYDSDADVLTVSIPAGQTLEVTGFRQTQETVSPLSSEDRKIFTAYGCEVHTEPQ